VNNVSSANYGHASVTRREVRTKLVDIGSNFVLQHTLEESGFMEDDIDDIQPATGSSFAETFTVSNQARTFSTGSFILELYLSDPHSDRMRRIIHHKFDVQISEGYIYNPTSQFLLIVNSSTDNEAITQMQKYIRSRLYLEVDTLNLSLTGSLVDATTRENILMKYRGKSIIITGNPFTYFSTYTRYNWDMIEPGDVLTLLMDRTSFLFCGVLSQRDQRSLAKWTDLMKYPADFGVQTAESSLRHHDRRAFLKSIHTQSSQGRFSLGLRNQYALKSKLNIFPGSTDKRLQSIGNALSRKLDKQAPLRRFLVTLEADKEEAPGNTVGLISIVEGLSRSTNCTISTRPIVDSFGIIASHQAVMIIASIPFHILCVLFWNIIRSVRSDGITPEVLYRNLPGFNTHADPHRYGGEDEGHGVRMINSKVLSQFHKRPSCLLLNCR